MKSSTGFEFNEENGLVYFRVDVKELFNVDLNTRGVPTALNKAFVDSKAPIPVATGLMKKSYTMEKTSDNNGVICFFDPNKIVGKKRLGRIVKSYYPQYLSEYAKRFNWLQIVMKEFYESLKSSMKNVAKNNKKVDDSQFKAFMSSFLLGYDFKLKMKMDLILKQRERQKALKEQIDKRRQIK